MIREVKGINSQKVMTIAKGPEGTTLEREIMKNMIIKGQKRRDLLIPRDHLAREMTLMREKREFK